MTEIDWRRIEVVDEAVAEILRRKTPADRVAMALECNRTMRLLLEAHFRNRHPGWNDQEIAAAVSRRMLRDAG